MPDGLQKEESLSKICGRSLRRSVIV
jgi:hypothetical protein